MHGKEGGGKMVVGTAPSPGREWSAGGAISSTISAFFVSMLVRLMWYGTNVVCLSCPVVMVMNSVDTEPFSRNSSTEDVINLVIEVCHCPFENINFRTNLLCHSECPRQVFVRCFRVEF